MKRSKLTLVMMLVLLVSGSTVFGTYSYTVTGHVYDRFTSAKEGGATVKHTIKWSASTTQTRTTTSKSSDGSYTFTYTGLATDPNGKAMSLTATSGSKKGGRSWTAAGYSQHKDCPVDTILLDPMLRIRTQAGNWAGLGVQPSFDPAGIYLDVGSAQLQSYQIQLTFEPARIQCNTVDPIQSYSVFTPVINNTAGTISVEATLDGSVAIGDFNTPTELFQMQWEVIDANSAYVTSISTTPDNNFMIDGIPENFAVINQSDHLVGKPDKCKATFLIDTKEKWQEALNSEWPNISIRPLTEAEWEEYRNFWEDSEGTNIEEGPGYFDECPDIDFLPPELYVYEGNDTNPNEPNDAGLVMYWDTNSNGADGNFATAFKYDFGLDPDLTNHTIQITVTAPQFGLSGQINQVSFDIVDIAGRRMGWWWAVGQPADPIQWNTPTTVTINTATAGLAATTPTATGFASAAGFNIAQSQSFDVDENSQWLFGQISVPPPGQMTFVGAWNYWHNLIVTKNTAIGSNKGIYTKWSQPPVDTTVPAGGDSTVTYIDGWDEWSNYNNGPVMADDWECNDPRPITDIHWWGSFQNWTLCQPPSVMPQAFHIGIWTDVPKNDPDNLMTDPNDSHPKELVWENICTSYVWNFAGIDIDPQGRADRQDETCFQFTQLLNEDEWFYQEAGPNVYWLSIAPVWDANQMTNPDFHAWGWKTRPHYYNDDAVRITNATIWPLKLTSNFLTGVAIEFPVDTTWDLAFELTTNEPAYVDDPIPGDISGLAGIPDGRVNFFDVAEIADNWLDESTP